MVSDKAEQAAWRMLDVLRAEMRTTDDSDDSLILVELNALEQTYSAGDLAAASQTVLELWRGGMANVRAHGLVDYRPVELITDLDAVIRQYEAARRPEWDVDAALTALRAFQDCVEAADPNVIGRARMLGLDDGDLAWGMYEVVRAALVLTSVHLELHIFGSQEMASDALFAGLRELAAKKLSPEVV